jgi:hypothetical protein
MLSSYKILFSNGDKISKKNIEKFDEIAAGLVKKNKDSFVELVLIINENINETMEKTKNLLKKDLEQLQTKLKNINNAPFEKIQEIKSLCENIIKSKYDVQKIEIQKRIYPFYRSYHKVIIDKINKKIEIYESSYSNFKKTKELLEKNFDEYLEEFKNLLLQDKSNTLSQTEIKLVERAYQEFIKTFIIYEEKLKSLKICYQKFQDKYCNRYIVESLEIGNLNHTFIAINTLYDEISLYLNGSKINELFMKFRNKTETESILKDCNQVKRILVNLNILLIFRKLILCN